jgi:hypothetical protein
MSSSGHGVEANAFGRPAKEGCRGDGMDGIGVIETREENGSQILHLQSFRRWRLVIVLEDSVREMKADGVVVAENNFVPLAIKAVNTGEGTVLGGSIQGVGAKSCFRLVVRNDVGWPADGSGPLQEADRFHANRHVLSGELNATCEEQKEEKPKRAEAGEHGPSVEREA